MHRRPQAPLPAALILLTIIVAAPLTVQSQQTIETPNKPLYLHYKVSFQYPVMITINYTSEGSGPRTIYYMNVFRFQEAEVHIWYDNETGQLNFSVYYIDPTIMLVKSEPAGEDRRHILLEEKPVQPWFNGSYTTMQTPWGLYLFRGDELISGFPYYTGRPIPEDGMVVVFPVLFLAGDYTSQSCWVEEEFVDEEYLASIEGLSYAKVGPGESYTAVYDTPTGTRMVTIGLNENATKSIWVIDHCENGGAILYTIDPDATVPPINSPLEGRHFATTLAAKWRIQESYGKIHVIAENDTALVIYQGIQAWRPPLIYQRSHEDPRPNIQAAAKITLIPIYIINAVYHWTGVLVQANLTGNMQILLPMLLLDQFPGNQPFTGKIEGTNQTSKIRTNITVQLLEAQNLPTEKPIITINKQNQTNTNTTQNINNIMNTRKYILSLMIILTISLIIMKKLNIF